MDTSVFLVKRQQIQARMDERRAFASSALASSRGSGLMVLALKGAGLAAGLGFGGGGSGRWIRSMLWAVAAPAVIGIIRRGKESLIQRFIHAVLPRR